MARPLEYKCRVQLPAELPLPQPRLKRRADVRFWGAFVWLGTAALAYSISAHALPLPGWLDGAAGGADDAAAFTDDTAPPQTTLPGATAPERSDSTPAAEVTTAAALAAAEPAPHERAVAEVAPDDRGGASEPAADDAPIAPATPHANDDADALAPVEPGTLAEEVPAFRAPAPPATPSTFTAGMSCEAAIATYRQQIVVGGPQGPADLSRDAFGSVLENGSWFAWCNVPASFSVNVCVAVKDGKTVGVTVLTGPRSYKTEACIARAAHRLHFASSPRLDVTRTVFEAD